MVVIGGGPIGLEMAQTFQRFGTAVTVLVRSNRILHKEDDDAARLVQNQLTKVGGRVVVACPEGSGVIGVCVQDGVTFVFGLTFEKIDHVPAADGKPFPEISVHTKKDGATRHNPTHAPRLTPYSRTPQANPSHSPATFSSSRRAASPTCTASVWKPPASNTTHQPASKSMTNCRPRNRISTPLATAAPSTFSRT